MAYPTLHGAFIVTLFDETIVLDTHSRWDRLGQGVLDEAVVGDGLVARKPTVVLVEPDDVAYGRSRRPDDVIPVDPDSRRVADHVDGRRVRGRIADDHVVGECHVVRADGFDVPPR